MSFTKIKIINEVNLKLEQRYLMREQAQPVPVAPAPPAQPTSATTTTTTTVPVPTTTTTTKKITDKEIKNLPKCSKYNSAKLGLIKGEEKDDIIVFNSKDGKPFCQKNKG